MRGLVVPTSGLLPAGLRVSLVPTLLRPSALFPAEEKAADAGGAFEVTGSVGEHEIVVEGLPPGWAVRGAHALWLEAGQTIGDVKVDIDRRH